MKNKTLKFTQKAKDWMMETLNLYDKKRNGFGVSNEVWNEVKNRGWYRTFRGWLVLTEKGRKEIPEFINVAQQ